MDDYKLKFELDIRGIQRSILPMIVLKVLSNSSEEMAGLRIKDAVIEFMERLIPTEEINQLSNASINTKEFEFHVSVLYPLLDYMRGRKWIREKAPPYLITAEGKKVLKQWQKIMIKLDQLQGDL